MAVKKEVSHEELITLEDEVALIKHIQQFPDDCESAKERLLLVNRRFVRAIAEKYASASHPVEGLMAEGNKGLLYSVNKFDETRGFKFISYAYWWINEAIRQYLENVKG